MVISIFSTLIINSMKPKSLIRVSPHLCVAIIYQETPLLFIRTSCPIFLFQFSWYPFSILFFPSGLRKILILLHLCFNLNLIDWFSQYAGWKWQVYIIFITFYFCGNLSYFVLHFSFLNLFIYSILISFPGFTSIVLLNNYNKCLTFLDK